MEKLDKNKIERENEERYLSELDKNPANHVANLPERPGEIWFDKLTDGEKFQVLTRYLGDIAAFNQSQLQINADLYILMEFVCEKMGIDIKAKKQELVKRYKADQEEQLKQIKEELKATKTA